jgi:hypothetical protein
MSKTYYCYLSEGFCPHKQGGKCKYGKSPCEYQHRTPKYTPPASSKKEVSDMCEHCAHESVCSWKPKFNQVKRDNYPAIVHCENYELRNIFKSI